MAGKNTQRGSGLLPKVFDMSEQQCVWSAAGVTEPRLCHNAFDCMSCALDKAMQRKKKLGWVAAGLERPTEGGGVWGRELWLRTPRGERWCRHMLSGRVAARDCDRLYECQHCEYDQMIEDNLGPSQGQGPALVPAAGFQLPPDYYFHPGHTWARVEYGGRVRVGLDDFAARVFGPAEEFRLPRLGQAVRGGGLDLAFSRQGHQARAASPVEGVVVAHNPAALKGASTLSGSPYLDGWLLLVEPQRDVRGLLTGEASVAWMEDEAQRLSDLITANTGQRLAATGGRVVADVFGSVPGLDWNRLVREFLQA